MRKPDIIYKDIRPGDIDLYIEDDEGCHKLVPVTFNREQRFDIQVWVREEAPCK